MKRLSARMALVAIIFLFVLPLILAWLLFSGSFGFRPAATANAGQLVQPVVPLPWNGIILDGNSQNPRMEMEGFWVIIFPLPEVCVTVCLERVAQLRQLHRTTGRNQESLKILLLSGLAPSPEFRNELLRIYSEFSLGSQPSKEFADALELALNSEQNSDADSRFYLVDPLGNIMMTYSGDSAPEKMRKDLKMLLTWSNQDKRL